MFTIHDKSYTKESDVSGGLLVSQLNNQETLYGAEEQHVSCNICLVTNQNNDSLLLFYFIIDINQTIKIQFR